MKSNRTRAPGPCARARGGRAGAAHERGGGRAGGAAAGAGEGVGARPPRGAARVLAAVPENKSGRPEEPISEPTQCTRGRGEDNYRSRNIHLLVENWLVSLRDVVLSTQFISTLFEQNRKE